MNGMRAGQALVVVLLILGVAVTIGLSIVARSITEVAVSTTEDESARALEAAEAGVEKALGGVIADYGRESLPSANASFDVRTVQNESDYYEVPYGLEAGEVATIDLSGYTGNGVRVCWGKGTGTRPAVEVMLYFKRRNSNSYADYAVGRVGYDRDGRASGFSTAAESGCPSGPAGYAASRMVSFSSMGFTGSYIPLFLRIRLLYNQSAWYVAVVRRGSDMLPVQGKDIISVGQAGDLTQKLHVVQMVPDLPPAFDAVLFSGNSEISQ